MRLPAALAGSFLVITVAAVSAPAAAGRSPGPGCVPARPGVVYTSAGTIATPVSARPVPCLITIPRSSQAKETQVAVTKAGTIVYQADLTMVDGQSAQPMQVAVSADRGKTWRATGQEIANGGIKNAGIDNHVYRDPATDRVFWIVYGVASNAPQPTLGTSSDGGRSWKLGAMPCCSDAENPHLLAARPRGSVTKGYPNVLYWCTNTSVVGGVVFPFGVRMCFTSHDGAATWDTGRILLNKPVASFPECIGRGELFDALDAYYPTADASGRLYMIVRCGPTDEYVSGPPTANPAFIVTSDDEMATWTKVADAPALPAGYGSPAGVAYKEEMRADRDGNLYLVRGTGTPTGTLHLWVSKDGGRHWSTDRTISLPGTHSVDAPLWQIAVGEPGHLVVDYAGTQGSSPNLNAYLIDTTTALSADPVFRGAVLNDPRGKVHLVNQLAAYDYTDVEIGPDGLARAAFPFGLVGSLANLPGGRQP
ncbi:MAG: repeat-like domain [Actinomycetota bacterium]|jgi:hypothetical protein|nr:repeat-like domain [Actinomycetota bacterium]